MQNVYKNKRRFTAAVAYLETKQANKYLYFPHILITLTS